MHVVADHFPLESLMTAQYVLYGGDHSLYTGKARAYLRFKDLDWEEQTASREIYKTVLLPKTGVAIVPVLATGDGHYVQDTTDIIDFLEAAHPAISVYPATPVQKLVALLLELYGDEWLVMPAMHYRWSVLEEQQDFIFSEFGRMSAPEASPEEQLAIGERTSRMFRGSVTALGVTEQTIPAIEQVYLEFLDQLNEHFSQYEYLLGSRPSIGDFGLIGPLYAHLGRDPVPKALMQERAPRVSAWVERMNNPVPLAGEFLPDDEIPSTLLPILQTMCRDQLPDVLDVIRNNTRWLEKNPGQSIPRVLGMHSFTTGPATGERYIHSYAQWLFQRSYAHYHGLTGEGRAAADALLRASGGFEALNSEISHWVARKPGQLELVESSR
jgi:glutathione S-transferase